MSLPQKEAQNLKQIYFQKKTETHQFLHFKSCHPFKCKKPIPYSQAIRNKCIFSEEHVLGDRLYDLQPWFLKRDYSENRVDQEIQHVNGIDRIIYLESPDHPLQNDT